MEVVFRDHMTEISKYGSQLETLSSQPHSTLFMVPLKLEVPLKGLRRI